MMPTPWPKLRLPKRLTVEQARGALAADEVVLSLEKVAALLDQIDQQAIHAEVAGRVTAERWDKRSPINGVPADQVLDRLRERGDWPEGGEIYLIRDGGQVVYLQPHRRDVDGVQPLTPVNVQPEAEAHAFDVIDECAMAEVAHRLNQRARRL